MRLSSEQINAPYYLTEPNLVVVSKDSYLSKYDILSSIKKNGIFLINSNKTDEEINSLLKNNTKEIIKERNIKVFISEASLLASNIT